MKGHIHLIKILVTVILFLIIFMMSDLLLFPMLLTVIFISLRLLIKSSDLLFVGKILSVF